MLLLVLDNLSINYRDFENFIVDHIALPIIIYDLYPHVYSVVYLCIYTSNTNILSAVDSYIGLTVLFRVCTCLISDGYVLLYWRWTELSIAGYHRPLWYSLYTVHSFSTYILLYWQAAGMIFDNELGTRVIDVH